MTTTLPGRLEDAFAHFSAIGAATIIEDAGHPALIWWEDGNPPRAQLKGVTLEELAKLIHGHAVRHASPGSWVQQVHDHLGRPVGTLSPRIAAPKDSSEAWENLARHRERVLDSDLSLSDHAFIAALGEPAGWLTEEPDRGASRWEMKTRNSGQDFVRSRLSPLAAVVASMTTHDVTASLSGARVEDPIAKNRNDSRTATGLRPIGPTDNVLAWCALWGISSTTLVPRALESSQTAGAHPRQHTHPHVMAIPVFIRPTTVTRIRQVWMSRAFDIAAFESAAGAGARTQLQEWGVAAILRCRTEVVGSSSAPERRLLAGDLEVLA